MHSNDRASRRLFDDVPAQLVIVAVMILALAAASSERARAETPASVVPLAENPLGAEFAACDADRDGRLTEGEYLQRAGRDQVRLLQEFRMFDLNGDGRITLAEFVTVPIGQDPKFRGKIADPAVVLSETKQEDLTKRWKGWDRDGDQLLTPAEFQSSRMTAHVPGLQATAFPDWDRNRDGKVSLQELAGVLEIAYGLRMPAGEPVRDPTGRVVDLRMFLNMQPDQNGRVRREVYVQALGGSIEVAKQWFPTIDEPNNSLFDLTAFSTSGHRTDPVGQFFLMDKNQDGRLSRQEMEALPVGWGPVGINWLEGFDDDRDGTYSLREFLFIPQINLLTTWHGARDEDDDGLLQPEEFRFGTGLFLAALGAEYFKRLDMNQDHALSLDEYPFTTTHRLPNEIHVQFADGNTVGIAIPEYPNIYSPEISPDGKWIAVDGWKRGQNSVAAHLLIASVETDEVRDLGIGCIPQWSVDGKKLAFSRYGRGVFIRNFEGDAEEQSIDPHGWAIEFSPDGKQSVYVKGGNNFVMHDLATNDKRLVFPEGTSPYNYIEHNFTISPDGERICFKGHRPEGGVDVGIVNTAGEPNLRVLCDGKDVSSDFSWFDEGKRLMFARHPAGTAFTQIFEINPDGKQPSARYPKQPRDRNNICVSWSRDGKTFVYLSIK